MEQLEGDEEPLKEVVAWFCKGVKRNVKDMMEVSFMVCFGVPICTSYNRPIEAGCLLV